MNFRQLFRHIKINIAVPIYQKGIVWLLRHKKQLNVVFVASTLSMWRYQELYELMSKHPRFRTSILILPSISYSYEQQAKDKLELITFFQEKGHEAALYVANDDSHINIKKRLKPDILFYPQPYIGYIDDSCNYDKFKYRLLCYSPYAFWMSKGDWSYNLPLHNYAWKLFYSTELHKKEAQEYALNKGRNIEVVGYTNTDKYLFQEHEDKWKPQDKHKKRIVWAPHFTISEEGFIIQSNFIWMADFMLSVAKRYFDRIQFAFKPHPRLFTELCKHQEWGIDRATAYYNMWETMGNTQLETNEFIDLFMTSDAMIHDSGSFCVEYLYSGNPTMYIARNFEEQVAEKGEFGQLAMRQQYVGKTEEDIIRFIENTVIAGNDPMKHKREEFVKQYLLPPNGKSVAENIMDVFVKAFC